MARSIYFSQGTRNEERLLEDLIIESIEQKGLPFFYIPRKLVGKNEILGEDRLSQFKQAFEIEMYLENVNGFDGAQSFMSKFGLQIEQSATLTVARRTWERCVGRYGATTLPDRPCEGDLIYFPMTDTLLEIKYVKYQDPFYQLGKMYVYKLQVETFQYASEYIDTGISEIDSFESLKSYDTDVTRTNFGAIKTVHLINGGKGYNYPPDVKVKGDGTGAEIVAVLGTGDQSDELVDLVINDGGYGFKSIPDIIIERPPNRSGMQAVGIVTEIEVNSDISQSFGDNSRFRNESTDILFSENNPFGEIK